MNHQLQTAQRDSLYPVTAEHQNEMPNEPISLRKNAFIRSLLIACVLVMGDEVVSIKQAPDSISHLAAHGGGMPLPVALAKSMWPSDGRSVDAVKSLPDKREPTTALRKEAQNGPQEKRRKVPTIAGTTPKTHIGSRSSAHPSHHERQQAAPQFNEFDAIVAIDKAAQRAQRCLGPNDSRPVMRVAVTFANSGRVQRSEVENGPYQNTVQGACIAEVLRSIAVKPFDGSAVTVHRAVKIQ